MHDAKEGTMTSRRILHVSAVAAICVLIGGAVAVAQGPDTSQDIFADQENETSKSQIAEEDAALIAIGEDRPASKPEDPENAGPTTDPEDQAAWNEGIYPGGGDFPSGAGYSFNTVWQGSSDGFNVRVFAGAYADKESVGVVLVDFIEPESWEHTFRGPFEAPIDGPLTISESSGTVISLIGGGGATVNFNVESLEFD